MNPSIQSIALSIAGNTGFGLAFVLALGHGNPGHMSTKIAWFVALVLIVIPIVRLWLHSRENFGNQTLTFGWRSHWLSRAHVLSIVALAVLTCVAAMSWIGDSFHLGLGYLGGILGALAVYCEAMVFVRHKAIKRWQSGWTPTTQLMFSMTIGTLVYMSLFGREAGSTSFKIWTYLSIVFLVVSWTFVFFAARRNRQNMGEREPLNGADRPELTGGAEAVEQAYIRAYYEPKNSRGTSALALGRSHGRVTLMTGLVLPIILLTLAMVSATNALAVLATISLLIGMSLERWTFLHAADPA